MNSIQFQIEKFDRQIGPRFDFLTWDNLTEVAQTDVEFCQEYARTFPMTSPNGLFLYSKISGNGKTSLAICTVKEIIKAGKTDYYSQFVEFDMLLKEIAYYAAKQAPIRMLPLVKKMRDADLIVLDDVGVEKMTAAVARHVYSLMNMLWRQKAYVIFTSKFTIEELIGRAQDDVETELLESIASRIKGMSTVRKLASKTDYRAKVRKDGPLRFLS